MMKSIKFQCLIIVILIIGVTFNVAIPRPAINVSDSKEIRSPLNFVGIKLPVKITTKQELIDWIKNSMQSMASKIDITLASSNESNTHTESLSTKNIKHRNVETSLPRHTFLDIDNHWLHGENEILSSLINTDAFLPLILGNTSPKFFTSDLKKYVYQENNKNSIATTEMSMEKLKITNNTLSNNSKSSSGSLRDFVDSKTPNVTSKLRNGRVPFAIPFEAYISITRESSIDDQKQEHQQTSTTPETRYPPDDFPPYFEKISVSRNTELKTEKNKLPMQSGKKEKSKKQQIAILGDILKMLGIIRKVTVKPKINEDATTSTVSVVKPTNKSHEGFLPQPSFDFEDLPLKPRKNNTSQRQEFDDDGADNDDNDDDDNYDDEEQGSLGSIAELLPLALPILEDLSDPESDTDLIEVLQSAIPLIQSLSEPDSEGNGGAKELIDMIVPIITKIVRGKDDQGSDLGAIVGPVFGLLAPLIGPILGPIIGPLIRTISNPPTEGSSLAALLTAIAGPLSTPQEPSGMSPLSIVIAGATAALLKELKPGTSGGSDLGALVGAILSGVLSGTSAGLSGGLSGPHEVHGHPGYTPYAVDFQAPAVAGTVNAIFTGRPSPGPPLNSPFNIVRPSHSVNTVNIGSTVRPLLLNHSPRPSGNVQQQYAKPGFASYVHSPPQSYSHNHGAVSAAATNGNGGSSYLPYESTAVPASSVNPLSLITMTVKDIFGAGIQVVSSLVNAIFGIIGASSQEQPKPSYGPPTSGSYNYASG